MKHTIEVWTTDRAPEILNPRSPLGRDVLGLTPSHRGWRLSAVGIIGSRSHSKPNAYQKAVALRDFGIHI